MWCMVYISLYTQISRLNGFKLRDFYFFEYVISNGIATASSLVIIVYSRVQLLLVTMTLVQFFFGAGGGGLLIPTTLAYLHIVVPNCGISKACIIWLVNQVYYLCEGDAVCSILILRQTYILLLSYINL